MLQFIPTDIVLMEKSLRVLSFLQEVGQSADVSGSRAVC
jgi:hypothetical protein